MERLSFFRNKKRNLNPTHICRHKLHFGEPPKDWKLKHKCMKEKCPWLMTKEEFDQWRGEKKVVYIG